MCGYSSRCLSWETRPLDLLKNVMCYSCAVVGGFLPNRLHHLRRRSSGATHALHRPCETRLQQPRCLHWQCRFLGDQHPILCWVGSAAGSARTSVQFLCLFGDNHGHQPRICFHRGSPSCLAGTLCAGHSSHFWNAAILEQVPELGPLQPCLARVECSWDWAHCDIGVFPHPGRLQAKPFWEDVHLHWHSWFYSCRSTEVVGASCGDLWWVAWGYCMGIAYVLNFFGSLQILYTAKNLLHFGP